MVGPDVWALPLQEFSKNCGHRFLKPCVSIFLPFIFESHVYLSVSDSFGLGIFILSWDLRPSGILSLLLEHQPRCIWALSVMPRAF